ncbi:MAG: hypothetical protein M3P53_08320 [Actinomycetota bacterium]|nr:hypothetical protein [Actinomycetota bacterium]
MAVEAKDAHDTINASMGLETFKAGAAVVQSVSGWVDRQGLERSELRRVPHTEGPSRGARPRTADRPYRFTQQASVGGLRLGFVRAPEPVALRFARVKATHDLGSSIVSQLLGERVLRSTAWPGRAATRNDDLRARYQQLATLLDERLPQWRWTEPSGGLSLWAQLPAPVARSFAALALRHGVAVATADALSSTPGGHADRIRLSFALPTADLRAGVDRLAAAWSARTTDESSRRRF